MKKISSFILVAFMGIFAVSAMVPSGEAMALTGAPECEHSILGLRPWYAGLTESVSNTITGSNNCVIKSPTELPGANDEEKMSLFVWTIVLNVLADLSLLIGYVALGFIIWGGFKYIMSSGEPAKVAQAKTTLMNAMIGLVIAILATVIVNTVLVVFGNAAS